MPSSNGDDASMLLLLRLLHVDELANVNVAAAFMFNRKPVGQIFAFFDRCGGGSKVWLRE